MVSYIETGLKEGAKLILDGRNIKVPGFENGYFVGPTIFANVGLKSKIGSEEIFGPVMCIMQAKDLDAVLRMIEESPFVNTASIFTQSGKWARDLHGQGYDAINFFTERKVVISRWF
ncbi:MAG: aldehyde dehydrogenase family protein [Candidatus Bathyarchaeia archaeon]